MMKFVDYCNEIQDDLLEFFGLSKRLHQAHNIGGR